MRLRAAVVGTTGWFDTPEAEGGARPKQRPPAGDDWRFWLCLAGRGWGKTRVIVEWAKLQAREMEGSRGMIVAATAADARDVIIDGESGFLAKDPECIWQPGKQLITWPRYGSQALVRSAEKPDRLRGPQQHWMIADELAAWQYPLAWDMAMLGLRLGTNPRCAIATTPRPIPIIRELVKDPMCVVSSGSTYENEANLAQAFIDQIVKKYEGTRLGRQELEALILEDVPGALWTRDVLDAQLADGAPELARIVVAVDPSVSDAETSAESGIIVAGVDRGGHGYLLDDRSLAGTVDERLAALVGAYHDYKADCIVVERNNGGDWIPHAITTHDPRAAVRTVWASRGKHTRAEPVAMLYEQGKIWHAGAFPQVEDQMATWVPGEPSPDRLDALVWAFTALMVDVKVGQPVAVAKGAAKDLYGSRERAGAKYSGRRRSPRGRR